jgi:hypothetical protein
MKINLICTQCGKTYPTYTCNTKNSLKTYCSNACYAQWQRNKSFESRGILKPKRLCVIDLCGKVHFGKGYCKKHYYLLIESRHKNKIKKVIQPLSFICINCNKEFNRLYKKPKFCSKSCCTKYRKKHFIIKKGYKKILIPNHIRADKKGYVFEHIIVLEQKLCRALLPNEVCHHIDGNKLNNNPDNLINFKDQASHQSFHRNQSISK